MVCAKLSGVSPNFVDLATTTSPLQSGEKEEAYLLVMFGTARYTSLMSYYLTDAQYEMH